MLLTSAQFDPNKLLVTQVFILSMLYAPGKADHFLASRRSFGNNSAAVTMCIFDIKVPV